MDDYLIQYCRHQCSAANPQRNSVTMVEQLVSQVAPQERTAAPTEPQVARRERTVD